jgi:hypothetical protein
VIEGTADPNNPATGMSTTPALHWNNETPNATYDVEIYDVTLPASVQVFAQSGINATSIFVPPNHLAPARHYRWLARATLNGHVSAWSVARYFNTGGSCVPVVAAPALAQANFKSGSGTMADPYIIGSTLGQPNANGVLGLVTVPGAVDYQVFGRGTEPGNPGFVVADLLMDSNGSPWAQGSVVAGVEYAAFVQAEDQYGCWKQSSTPYYIGWTW